MLGRLVVLVGNENENVPLHYHIVNNLQIQFGREEFCLVTGLRFGVEYWVDYDNDEDPFPFRRRVFSSSLDGEHITGKFVETLIDSKLFDRLHDDDAVSLCCVGILQLVFLVAAVVILEQLFGVKRAGFCKAWLLIFFHGNLPVERLTPDDTEARYDWWVSSRAYFDGVIVQAERGGRSSFQTQANNSFLNMGTPTNWQTPMPSQPGLSNWQSHMAAQSATPFMQPAIPSQHGTYNWQSQIPSHMGNPNSQTLIETHPDAAGILDQNIHNRGKREHRPSMYRWTPYVEQAPIIVLPKQRGNKNKNKVHKATVLPLNLENVFDDDNEGSDDIMFVSGQFTGNMLVYENVDPNKVRRDNYVNLSEFLNNPHEIYLDCYMKGCSVPTSFWRQLVPYLCTPDIYRLEQANQVGWLSGDHMNSWMELLIRSRPENAPWTVAKTGTRGMMLTGCLCPYMLQEIIRSLV
ncbi:hypothetical protein Tco_1404338 [Tanacetum coccineum]